MSAPKGPKKDMQMHNLKSFLEENRWDALAYLILFFGLIFSIFERFIGGIIVGIVLGLYFSQEAKDKFAEFKEFLAVEGIFRGFVIVAAIIALLIASPGLCIGVVLGAFLRPLFGDTLSGPFDR